MVLLICRGFVEQRPHADPQAGTQTPRRPRRQAHGRPMCAGARHQALFHRHRWHDGRPSLEVSHLRAEALASATEAEATSRSILATIVTAGERGRAEESLG